MRSQTRSDVKWLVNEVATLAGELARVDNELARLAKHRTAVEKAHQACVQTLALVTGQASPLALPTVRAHRAYGGRGKLRQLIRDALRSNAPASLDSNELVLKAIESFGLTFSSPDELYRFRDNSIARALRHIEQQGDIERVGERWVGAHVFGAWRWKTTLPTLDELAGQVRDGAPVVPAASIGVPEEG